MSEFQYYEFQKLDGRLTPKEMTRLRSYSSRAEITPTSFVNEYEYGDFKGDQDAWMDKYFDAFLYFANWGTRELQLAIPAELIPLTLVKQYCSCRERSGKLIVTFLYEDEPIYEYVDTDDLVPFLLEIRNEWIQGDYRSLYLGWLVGVQTGEFKDSVKEPPVPPNLQKLTDAQQRLAEFLQLSPELWDIASRVSPDTGEDTASSQELTAWMSSLPVTEKDEILVQVMMGDASKASRDLQSRFVRQRKTDSPVPATNPRTVGELRRDWLAFVDEQELKARQQADIKAAARKKKDALAREKHLDSLQGDHENLWNQVEALVSSKKQAEYKEALRKLVDLRDLSVREGNENEFSNKLDSLRERHLSKKAFLKLLEGKFPRVRKP